MRVNEFEKKVQEQMEDLHLRPSPTVWMEVERELRKKKKRRIAFYFSLFAGLGLAGYSGYTFFAPAPAGPVANQEQSISSPDKASNGNTTILSPTDNNTKNNTTTIDQTLLEPDNTPVANNHEKVTQPADQGDIQSASQPVNHPDQSKQAQTKESKTVYTQAPSTSSKGQMTVIQTSPPIKKKVEPKTNPLEDQKQVSQEEPIASVTDQQPVITDEQGKDIAKDTREITSSQASLVDSIKKDSAIAKTDLMTDLPDSIKTDIAIIQEKPSKKIKLGFDLSGGRNLSRTQSFEVPGTALLESRFNNDLTNFYGGVGAGAANPGPVGGGFVRPPSPVEAGMAFKAGVSAEIPLTKRSSLLTGLRYTYLSESIKVGAIRDTSIFTNSYMPVQSANTGLSLVAYYGPQNKLYTNRYHFIELPVSYQLQLNKGKKVQLLWNAGASASFLLSTNALVYDTAAYGIYYKSNKAYNKLHLGIQSGLSIRFGDAKKLQWSIGPEFSMDMSRLMKKEFILRNRYLMYGGLTARVLFPGKNK